jgi:EAL domain-containing protein (putative c-di-GMP-specific phosphodiesterase class I)
VVGFSASAGCHVTTLLARHAVLAVLEAAGSLVREDREWAGGVLARLRDVGEGVSIDDYGIGYSSPAYLAGLPVTELQIDRCFVVGMARSARRADSVTSTLQVVHAL